MSVHLGQPGRTHQKFQGISKCMTVTFSVQARIGLHGFVTKPRDPYEVSRILSNVAPRNGYKTRGKRDSEIDNGANVVICNHGL